MVEQKFIFNAGNVFAILVACFFLANGSAHSMGLPEPDPDPVEPVITPGPLGAPIRVASYSEDTLLVTDYRSGTVFTVNNIDPNVVDPLFTIEGRALAVGHLGNSIIVGNATTGNVEVYGKRGKGKSKYFREYILNNGDPIDRPSDIAVDHTEEMIFIVDSRENQVRVYDKYSLLYTFGAGYLLNPVGIALDPLNGMVYVSDHGNLELDPPVNPAVMKFSYAGVHLGTIEGNTFEFSRPRGIAYDLGRIYVTDALAGTVTVIDVNSMNKVAVLGEYGAEPGHLIQPQDVTLDEGGTQVYVANKRLGRIEVISIGGQLQ